MPKNFMARLRKIKQTSEDKAAATVAAQREVEVARREQRNRYYDLREKLVATIDEAFDGFCAEFEGFRKHSAYQGDDYTIAVGYDEVMLSGARNVQMENFLSQLTFAIRGLRDSDFFVVTAKTVLCNKEAGTRTWDDKIENVDAEAIIEFAQNEVLRFAERFGARASLVEDR